MDKENESTAVNNRLNEYLNSGSTRDIPIKDSVTTGGTKYADTAIADPIVYDLVKTMVTGMANSPIHWEHTIQIAIEGKEALQKLGIIVDK